MIKLKLIRSGNDIDKQLDIQSTQGEKAHEHGYMFCPIGQIIQDFLKLPLRLPKGNTVSLN